MTTLLDELTELDRRFIAGRLSERAYRRAKEALIAARAGTSDLGKTHQRRPPDTKRQPDDTETRRRTRRSPRGPRPEEAVRRPGNPALAALLFLILGAAFCEFLAQSLGNGLPYHEVAGQLILLPGAAVYLFNGLSTAGSLPEAQLVLAGLLTACYLLIPYAAARAFRRRPNLFAGFSIALTYIAGAAVVSHLYLTVFNTFTLDLWTHTVIPALIGAAVLGAFFTGLILVRRAVS